MPFRRDHIQQVQGVQQVHGQQRVHGKLVDGFCVLHIQHRIKHHCIGVLLSVMFTVSPNAATIPSVMRDIEVAADQTTSGLTEGDEVRHIPLVSAIC